MKPVLLAALFLCSGCQALSDLSGELRYSWNYEPCDGQDCSHSYAPLMQRPSCPKHTTPPPEPADPPNLEAEGMSP